MSSNLTSAIMRIISKFHDYYDTAAAFGLDTDIVYVRKTIEVEEARRGRSMTLLIHPQNGTRYEYENGHVGFCGQFYPFVEVSYYTSKFHRLIFWSFDELDAWMESVSPGWKIGYKRRRSISWPAARFQKHFETKYNTEIFHTHQVPVFCKMSNGRFTLNPRLQDLEFYRVFDPYQAHQEIAMFVGGVLKQPENNMVQISNEDKIVKHGFDDKSFRKEPGSKKRKRRK